MSSEKTYDMTADHKRWLPILRVFAFYCNDVQSIDFIHLRELHNSKSSTYTEIERESLNAAANLLQVWIAEGRSGKHELRDGSVFNWETFKNIEVPKYYEKHAQR